MSDSEVAGSVPTSPMSADKIKLLQQITVRAFSFGFHVEK